MEILEAKQDFIQVLEENVIQGGATQPPIRKLNDNIWHIAI